MALDVAIIVNTVIGLCYLAIVGMLLIGMNVSTPVRSGALYRLMQVFLGMFFVGCGLHHLHLAYHLAFLGPHITHTEGHSILFGLMQVVGAPGVVGLAYILRWQIARDEQDD